MVISFCIPVHNRTYDLKRIMPYLVRAANTSPPVEIVIFDYNSPDDLADYIEMIRETLPLKVGNRLTYTRYTGREYYHMAHARNLSVKASAGEIIIILSADIYPAREFVQVVRELLRDGYVWMHGKLYTGAIICQRREFMDAGGYDERFEFYGPEDTDLDDRLTRRGGEFGRLPANLLNVIVTPDEEKIKNYRLPLSKREMHQRMKPIYEENRAAGLLVANQGREWGQV